MEKSTLDANETALLGLFKRPTDGRFKAGDLKTAAKKSLDVAQMDQTIQGLLAKGLLESIGGGKEGTHPRPGATYRLTDKGRHQLKPSRPEIPESQLQTQESFILLQVFRAKEKRLTRSDLNGKLKTKAAVGQLEFDVKAAPETIDYHLATLVDKGCLLEHKKGTSVSYSFDVERGTAALAVVKQHDAVSFTLSGETLNALLAAARKPLVSSEAETSSHRPAVVIETQAGHSLDSSDIHKYVRQLIADQYAGKDLVPIHEVRKLVAANHGAEAASHPVFDPLIKRMRSDDELDIIAISDNRSATQEQLNDAIPGMNETLFYIVIQ